jgi:predicted nucleic acid-binding protein
LDTGPLVAYLSRDDQYHDWAIGELQNATGRLITCEAVLTEAFFLLRNNSAQLAALDSMLCDGVSDVTFSLGREATSVMELRRSYESLPMSLADACVVRLSELHQHLHVLTVDSDFRIYRRNRRQTLPILIPDSR